MIFVLVVGGQTDIRLFQSYSAVEQVMKRGIQTASKRGQPPNWCYVIEYTGIDELLPTFAYYINDFGDIVRETIA
jgi:hypothetical protein